MSEVIFEGVTLTVEEISRDLSNLAPGDTVIGKRRDALEWLMGTVSERLWEKTKETGWLYCNEARWYPFNIGECRKVVGGI